MRLVVRQLFFLTPIMPAPFDVPTPPEEDKVNVWLAEQEIRRNRERFSLRELLVLVSLLGILCALWVVMRSMPYTGREFSLVGLTLAQIFPPLAARVARRRTQFALLLFNVYCMCLGAAYSSDMGASGHMLTSGFLMLGSLVSAVAVVCISISTPSNNHRRRF